MTSLRFEDRLEGAYNVSPWKERIVLVLMEKNLWEFAKVWVTPPTNATTLVAHSLKDVKSRRMIVDVVKDFVIPHILGNKSGHEMWTALMSLYRTDN